MRGIVPKREALPGEWRSSFVAVVREKRDPRASWPAFRRLRQSNMGVYVPVREAIVDIAGRLRRKAVWAASCLDSPKPPTSSLIST